MIPVDRASYIQYCLRNLGEPVIEVNVDDDQIDDRVDEALQYYTMYHYEGTIKTFLKHQITQLDMDAGKIAIPDYVFNVQRITPFSNVVSSSNLFFDVNYQLMLSDLYNLTTTDVLYYSQLNEHINLLNNLLNAVPSFQFNRNMGFIEFPNSPEGLDKRLRVGEWILIECYRAIDPVQFSRIWNDQWLKRYGTALIKRSWATNLKKYSNMQLPGGVIIDGIAMYQEAVAEIKELEEELIDKMAPLDWFMG